MIKGGGISKKLLPLHCLKKEKDDNTASTEFIFLTVCRIVCCGGEPFYGAGDVVERRCAADDGGRSGGVCGDISL